MISSLDREEYTPGRIFLLMLSRYVPPNSCRPRVRLSESYKSHTNTKSPSPNNPIPRSNSHTVSPCMLRSNPRTPKATSRRLDSRQPPAPPLPPSPSPTPASTPHGRGVPQLSWAKYNSQPLDNSPVFSLPKQPQHNFHLQHPSYTNQHQHG